MWLKTKQRHDTFITQKCKSFNFFITPYNLVRSSTQEWFYAFLLIPLKKLLQGGIRCLPGLISQSSRAFASVVSGILELPRSRAISCSLPAMSSSVTLLHVAEDVLEEAGPSCYTKSRLATEGIYTKSRLAAGMSCTKSRIMLRQVLDIVSNAASWEVVFQTLLITVVGRFLIDLILVEFLLHGLSSLSEFNVVAPFRGW